MQENYHRAIDNIIHHCGQLKSGETFLVVYEQSTQDIAELFKAYCHQKQLHCDLALSKGLNIHGAEPESSIVNLFEQYDLIAGLTKFSMAHSQARQNLTLRGGRYLSLPDYDLEVLTSKALTVDFSEQRPLAKALATALEKTINIKVTSDAGTELTLKVEGRSVNNCDCILDQPGSMASPPDIEVNIAPIEKSTCGTMVVDCSIPHPHFGLLDSPIILEFEEGLATSIHSSNQAYRDNLEALFSLHGERARYVGECGFGLNPYAQPTGKMLEDEGAKGYIHFGLGSNITIGGTNEVGIHLDCVCSKPNVWFDEKHIIDNGVYLIGNECDSN